MEIPQRAAGPDGKSFAEMEASLERAGRVEELIRLYETRARDAAAQDAALALAKAGELARDRLKSAPRAEELFRKALLYVPGHRKPLLGLKVLFEQRQDHSGLAEVLERLAAHFSGAEAAALFLRAADLYEQKLGRRDRAVLCVQRATHADPRDRQAFRRLRALFTQERRHRSVLDVLLRERKALGDSGIADELVNFAEKLLEDPTEHEVALRALEAALEIDPRNARAPLAHRALQKFEQSWRSRAQALKTQSFEERDRKTAARYSLQVAKLFAWYDAAAAPKLKEALDRCFMLWPAMPEGLELSERIAEKGGDFKPAVAQLEKMAQEAKDRTAQVDLWVRSGMLRLGRLEDAEGARAAFARANQADPSRADAAGLLAELYLEAGRAPEAVAALERHASTVKDRATQVAVELRIAQLCFDLLKDAERAWTHLSQVIRLDPSNASAAFQAAQLSVQADEVDGLERLLEQAQRVAQIAQPPAALELWRNLAELLQSPLSRPDEALAAWQEVLKRSPQDAAALEAVRRLKGPGPRAAVTPLPAAPGAPPPPAKEPATTQPMAHPKVQLEIEAKRLEGSAADPAAAAEVYRKILALDPDDVSALKRLGASCAAMGQWAEVAKVAARLAELSPAKEERQEWRARLAQLYAERLGRKDEAV